LIPISWLHIKRFSGSTVIQNIWALHLICGLGQIFVKLFESLSIVAKPTSSNPAVMTANHAMQKYYQR
jgi:hypothetical protein